MATVNLGRVGMLPKGQYDPAATYSKLDVVTYRGDAYCALKTLTGVTPTDDGISWRLMVEGGKDADVTKEAIESALGYVPADEAAVTEVREALATKADVSDLRSTITPVYATGKGRYLYGGEPTSTLQPGNVYTASRYATCDFLPVVPGMTLHLEGFRADNQRAVCAYNRAKELVKVLAVGQPVGYTIDEVLPDDAYFIRACTDYDNTTGDVTGAITGYLYGNISDLVVKHDAEIGELKDDYTDVVALLAAIRDALKNGDIDRAIDLLDTFLIGEDGGVLK